MKSVLLLTAALFAAANLMAADLTGTWTGTLVQQSNEGSKESGAHVTLKQDGKTITGSGGPNADEQHTISKGTVEGEVVKFEIALENGVLRFSLKSTGDAIEGEVLQEREGETRNGKLTLKRVK